MFVYAKQAIETLAIQYLQRIFACGYGNLVICFVFLLYNIMLDKLFQSIWINTILKYSVIHTLYMVVLGTTP